MFNKRRGHVLLLIIFLLELILCLSKRVYAEDETLRIAFNPNAAPYHFIDKDGYFAGMHIDMMNWIADKKNIKAIYIPYETNSECINALNNKKVDVVLGHKTNDKAASGLQYTNELSSSSLCLIASNEFARTIDDSHDYRKYSAVIEFGTAANYNMLKMGIRRYLSKADQVAVLESLTSGQADIAIAVYDSCMYLLNASGLKNEYTVLRRYVSPISYAMVVRQNDIHIFNLIESGLTEMRASGSYEKIFKKWQLEDERFIAIERMRKIIFLVVSITCITIIVVLFNIMINKMLKRKVEEKTKELYDANKELDRRMIQIQSDSRNRYGMIEFSPSGMVSFDTNFQITLINNAALYLSGTKESCLGRDVRDLKVFGDILKSIDYDIFSLEYYSEKVSRPVTIEVGGVTDRKVYRYNIYSSRDETGISSILLNVEDVTVEEQKKQELFAKEKNRSLNLLIAGIAHEIKNPLMAIRTAASLLKVQGNEPEVQKAFTKFVPGEVDRINQLVDGLINYARPVKGKREVANLTSIVRECLYLTKFGAKYDNIRYRINLEESVFVYVNRDKIKQALINVIMNSIESMEIKLNKEQNRMLVMNIDVNKYSEWAMVCIRDEGVGMSESQISRCMEPFYTTKAASTGLGLALVRQYIEENDGNIEIRSVLGRSTTIILKFRKVDDNEI